MLLKQTELTVFQIKAPTEEAQATSLEEPETCNPTHTHNSHNLSWFSCGSSACYGRSGVNKSVRHMTYNLADLWNEMKQDKRRTNTATGLVLRQVQHNHTLLLQGY
jgi:hypothetical protein